MSSFFHGVRTSEQDTKMYGVAAVDSAIPVVIGVAPLNNGGNLENVNKPVLVNNYTEAVAAFGDSNDIGTYTIAEFIYSQFKLFNKGPAVFINVLDPEKHKGIKTKTTENLESGKFVVEHSGILDATLKVYKGSTSSELVRDTDYVFNFIDNIPVINVLDDTITTIELEYEYLDPSKVTKNDIIGGIDATTKQKKGMECINEVFPKYRIVPGLLLAPKYSADPLVATILSTKGEAINTVFSALAIVDLPADKVYTDLPEFKNLNNMINRNQYLVYPKAKMGDLVFNGSTQVAGVIATTDANNNGVPSQSPSNQTIQATAAVMEDGRELSMGLDEANYLNSQGITTLLNFVGGWKLWGNRTACYPEKSTDPKDMWVNVRRMFMYVSNTVILTTWQKVDSKITKVLLDMIQETINGWLSGLVTEGHLLGAKCVFLEEENPDINLIDGKIKFHLYMTPPTPAEEIEFVQEFDLDNLKNLF